MKLGKSISQSYNHKTNNSIALSAMTWPPRSSVTARLSNTRSNSLSRRLVTQFLNFSIFRTWIATFGTRTNVLIRVGTLTSHLSLTHPTMLSWSSLISQLLVAVSISHSPKWIVQVDRGWQVLQTLFGLRAMRSMTASLSHIKSSLMASLLLMPSHCSLRLQRTISSACMKSPEVIQT